MKVTYLGTIDDLDLSFTIIYKFSHNEMTVEEIVDRYGEKDGEVEETYDGGNIHYSDDRIYAIIIDSCTGYIDMYKKLNN